MAKSEKQVADPKSADVVPMESLFEADAGRGNENISQDDLATPFLKILSGNDPILDVHETARKGDILNNVTNRVYKGKDGIRVVPVAYQRRFIQWAPRGQGSGAPMAIFTPNEARPETKRSEEDNKEYVVGGTGDYIEETHQHFVIVINDDGTPETALIAMKATQLKKSRKWNSMIASITMQGKNGPFQPPRFSHVYKLTTLGEENSKGSWHGWEMAKEGVVTDSHVYQQAKKFAESVSAGDVVVKHTEANNDSGDNSVPF